MSALIWIVAAGFALPAQADDLSGTLTSIDNVSGKQVAHFRTATQNVDLDLDALPAAVQKQLQAPEAKTTRINIKADAVQIISRTDVPFGVRSDCGELPIEVDELDKLAKDPKTTSMVDFLKKIPPGALQGFTFVTHSKSAQRGPDFKPGDPIPPGAVSPMWPRALRASIDGRLTISFVCDPKNPSFGKVEVIEYNKKTREFETTEWDFGTPDKPVPPGERVKKNPESCRECHSGSMTNLNGKPHPSLKPNWPEYFFWGDCQRDRGITLFGMSDDNMGGTVRGRLPTTPTRQPQGCDSSSDSSSVQAQNKEWQDFRTSQKDNECFNTLPWAKVDPNAPPPSDSTKDYRFYPYANRAQDVGPDGFQNYTTRTNARFTDGYSHYLADRNAALLKADPDYELMKYYLVMERAQCLTQKDQDDIARMLGLKYQFNNRDPNGLGNDYSLPSSQPVLYSYGKKAGVDDHDWSMEFKLKGDPDYNAVIFGGPSEFNQDSKIFNVVTGNILREIREENSVIREAAPDPFVRGITGNFGPRFGCIDDIGGDIKRSIRSQGSSGQFCQALRSENDKRLKTLLAKRTRDCDQCRNSSQTASKAKTLSDQMRTLASTIDKDSAERGRKLVKADGKGKCVTCHTNGGDQGLPDDLLFVMDENTPPAQQAANMARLKARVAEGNFIDTVKKRVVEKKRMPPDGLGKALTDQDRNDIVSYIESLIVK